MGFTKLTRNGEVGRTIQRRRISRLQRRISAIWIHEKRAAGMWSRSTWTPFLTRH